MKDHAGYSLIVQLSETIYIGGLDGYIYYFVPIFLETFYSSATPRMLSSTGYEQKLRKQLITTYDLYSIYHFKEVS